MNGSGLIERLGETELHHLPIEGKRVAVELVVHIRVAVVQAQKGFGRELIHHATGPHDRRIGEAGPGRGAELIPAAIVHIGDREQFRNGRLLRQRDRDHVRPERLRLKLKRGADPEIVGQGQGGRPILPEQGQMPNGGDEGRRARAHQVPLQYGRPGLRLQGHKGRQRVLPPHGHAPRGKGPRRLRAKITVRIDRVHREQILRRRLQGEPTRIALVRAIDQDPGLQHLRGPVADEPGRIAPQQADRLGEGHGEIGAQHIAVHIDAPHLKAAREGGRTTAGQIPHDKRRGLRGIDVRIRGRYWRPHN